jgi:hypothetical protein
LRSRALLAPGLLFVVASVATCRLDMLLKPSATRSQPELAVAPLSIRDSARAGSRDERRIEVEIRNSGTGDDAFEWSAEERHPWIRLSERDGVLPDTITITLDPEDLDPGTHEGSITITASGMPDSQATIHVTFIAQRAGLIVLPSALEHSANVTADVTFHDTLRVDNGGNGPLEWTADEDRSWISLGSAAGSGPGIIAVTINSGGLAAGVHHEEIVVTAPGAFGSPARIDVTLTVFAPGLSVTPGFIRETADPGSTTPKTQTLRVANSGSGPLTWTAAEGATWLSLSASAGSAPADVVVTIDPTGLPPGAYADTIRFTSPEATNDPILVPVDLSIAQPALVVSPEAIVDAVGPGDNTPRVHTLSVSNGGVGALAWTAARSGSWISLAPDAGITPGSITVTLNPAGLAPGVHVGEVVVTAPGASGSPARIPVTFTIARACGETSVTPDATVSGSLNVGDCESPRRPGSLAELYSVSANAGDVLSFRLSASFDAYLIVSNEAGTPLAQNDDCGPESRAACVREFAVPAPGRYIVDATSAGAGENGAFTLTVTRELAPPPPQGIQQRENDGGNLNVGETINEDAVLFRGTIDDPNPRDSVRLEVELEPLGSPFTNAPTHRGELVAIAGGDRTVEVRASGLADQTGYHWQARTCDRTGRCSTWLPFGSNAESEADFRVSREPDGSPPSGGPPQQLQADGVTAIGVGGEATGPHVVLAASASDPDPADVLRVEIEVKETTLGFDGGNLLIASGLASGAIGSVTFAPAPAGAYHWRARVCDQTERCSSWASFPGGAPNAETDPDFRGPPAGSAPQPLPEAERSSRPVGGIS